MKIESSTVARSLCPLSKALELIGDKWSLVIVRDMCLGKKRYCDFQHSPEGIPTNILADRLKKLEEHGIIGKRSYQQKPVRFEYFLTPKGADLLPVMQHLIIWMKKYDPDCWTPPEGFYEATPESLLQTYSEID